MGNYEKFIAAFECLTGKFPPNNSLQNRIIVQKIAYLLQKKKISFGYTFDWYIYGVFSRELWKINSDTPKTTIPANELSSAETGMINTLKTESKLKTFFSSSDELELVTSLIYWAEQLQLPVDDKEVKDLVRSTKPRFKESEYQKAIEIAKMFND